MRGKEPETLKGFLKGMEKSEEVGAVAVHWLNHNSDDQLKKQPGVSFQVGFHALFTKILRSMKNVNSGRVFLIVFPLVPFSPFESPAIRISMALDISR